MERGDGMNTRIDYLYRDGSNNKKPNAAVVSGEISQDQIDLILSCLEDGEYFIPEQVGLPAKRFEEYRFDDGVDHPFLELSPYGFKLTDKPATVDLSVKELVCNFVYAKDHWRLDDFGW